MPRKVRDANLETRTARARLKVAGRPYYRLIEPGLHLGFRKLPTGPGRWVVRRYGGDGRYTVENLRSTDGDVVLADDYSEADGVRVLSFGQAQDRARELLAVRGGPFTVDDALDMYLVKIERDGKNLRDAALRFDAFVRPKLGKVEVAALTADRINTWVRELAKTPPRVRTRSGDPQAFRSVGKGADPEALRRRQASANRNLAVLKAALNVAWREGKVELDSAWRRVEAFRKVSVARLRYLSIDEATRLINSCDPDFRKVVTAALQTGARYGELVRLVVGDFDPDAGAILIRRSKSGRSRQIVLSDEAIAFFRGICAGRAGGDVMLLRDDGLPWGPAHQQVRIVDACKRARISPPIGIHALRHSYASHMVMGGVPLMVVAKNLGHAGTEITERHYSHLAPSYERDAIRAGAPKFGAAVDQVVRPLSRRR